MNEEKKELNAQKDVIDKMLELIINLTKKIWEKLKSSCKTRE
jgi:hypothetical protein